MPNDVPPRRRRRRIPGVRGSCVSGKVRYRDAIAAKTALARIAKRDSPGHTEQRSYPCPDCAGWHLTSK